MFLQNTGIYLEVHMVSKPRMKSSLLWEPLST
jgi:hypothetical protein